MFNNRLTNSPHQRADSSSTWTRAPPQRGASACWHCSRRSRQVWANPGVSRMVCSARCTFAGESGPGAITFVHHPFDLRVCRSNFGNY